MAEEGGFEPPVDGKPTVDFESTAFNHSATPPHAHESIFGGWLLSQLAKKRPQQLGAGVLFDAGRHVKSVIQRWLAGQVIQCSEVAPLGIGTSVHAVRHASQDHGPCAHRAGFQGHIDRAILQSPAAEMFSGSTHGQKLGMCRGILARLSQVVSASNDLPFVHNHRAHGDLANSAGPRSLLECFAHECVVDGCIHIPPESKNGGHVP